MSESKVYIILVNYGTPDDTVACLESILDNNHQLFEVVIVEVQNKNGSLHKINHWVESKQDERFTLIEEQNNKGFAYANNIGIKYARAQNDGEFIWLLNNDTVIPADSLEALINCYHSRAQTGFIGFIGSKTLDYTNRKLIQNVGGTFNKWTGYSLLKGMGEEDTGQYENGSFNIDYVVGASMFFHISLPDKIGLMPEAYFLYVEDIDWSITAKKAGFKNITCTESIIYHKQGSTTGTKLLTGKVNLSIKKHLYQSYLILYQRHFKWFLPIAYFILFKQLAGRLYHKEWQEARVIWRVIFRNR